MRETTSAYLAYFDILGFKKIVEKSANSDLDKLYEQILNATQWAKADGGVQVNPQEVKPVFNNAVIRAVNVSDSIIFFSEDATENSLKAILAAIANFMKTVKFYCTFRGCLVVGCFNYKLFNIKGPGNEVVHSVSSIYGKALIEAFQKAEAQEWIGLFIDKSVTEHADKNSFDKANFDAYVLYDVPFKKNGCIVKQSTVRQLAFKMTLSDSSGESYEEQVKALFELNGLSFGKDVLLKYKNTLAFRKYCNKLA